MSDSIYDSENELVPIQIIDKAINLVPYLRDIQIWLSAYVCNIDGSLLRLYYKSFTDLVSHTAPKISGMNYIREKLGAIKFIKFQNKFYKSLSDCKFADFQSAINFLYNYVEITCKSDLEDSGNADLISRVFIWILENGDLQYTQAELNAAKQAIAPLWKLSRFERRYIDPNRFI